ncbi:MAG: hypothetical protein V3S77_06600, partial [Acidiferrobacterales bacterium]
MQAGAITGTVLVAIGLLFVLAGTSASELTKESLFRTANDAYEAAQRAEANVFVPKSYARAVKHYR